MDTPSLNESSTSGTTCTALLYLPEGAVMQETDDPPLYAFSNTGHDGIDYSDNTTVLLTSETAVNEETRSNAYVETEHDDTGSYDSETLLIPASETNESNLPQTNDKMSGHTDMKDTTEVFTDVDINGSIHKVVSMSGTRKDLAGLGQSYTSMFDDIVNVVEEVKVTPLQIIGSGWEFGSISSIHRRPVDGMRSRSNTLETRQGDAGSRLLSRVFAKQIGTIDLLEKNADGLDIKRSVSECHVQAVEPLGETRTGNRKNIIAVSLGAMLLHVAQFGLRNLQSSMNSEGGIGVISMGIICTAYVFGSLLSPFVVQRLGPKRCLVLGSGAQLFYVFANYYSTWLTIIPSSLVLGLGSALMWNSVSTYITETGIQEAELKNKRSEHVISRYFGFFFLTLQMAMVFGNLISSLILVPKHEKESMGHHNISAENVTIQNLNLDVGDYKVGSSLTTNSNESVIASSEAANVCGIGFCNVESATVQPVDDLDKLFLIGTYASCGILSVLVLQFCLDRIPNYSTRKSSLREVASQALAVLSMVFDREYGLVVPMCLYSYMSMGFVIADALKAYITCPLGIYMVGYTMICFGLCGSVSSFTFGKIVRHTGRIPIFVTAALINLASLAAMVIWRPTSDDINYLFVLIGAWGFADGIWQSQINSLMSTVFSDRYETAFGTFRVLQGVAGMIVFSISTFFCMMTKVSVTAAMCLLSVICYLVMEIRRKRAVLVQDIYVKSDA